MAEAASANTGDVATVAEAEVTVTAAGEYGMTTDRFIELLRANGFVGNVATNASRPGVVWIGFRRP